MRAALVLGLGLLGVTVEASAQPTADGDRRGLEAKAKDRRLSGLPLER